MCDARTVIEMAFMIKGRAVVFQLVFAASLFRNCELSVYVFSLGLRQVFLVKKTKIELHLQFFGLLDSPVH